MAFCVGGWVIYVFGRNVGGFLKLGVLFWGLYNEGYSIFGSILGYPNFEKLAIVFLYENLNLALYCLLFLSRYLPNKKGTRERAFLNKH